MLYSGTDPESYITEYPLLHEDYPDLVLLGWGVAGCLLTGASTHDELLLLLLYSRYRS